MMDKLQLTILGGVGIGAALMYVLNTNRKSKLDLGDVAEPVSNNLIISRIRAMKAAMRESSLSESDSLKLAMAP